MYAILVVLHILLTVSWLGVDAGVFIGSHMIRNQRYSAEARYLVSRLMGYLDIGPRLSVPLLFAVGLHMALLGGWAMLPGGSVVLAWVVAVTWCVAIVYAFVLQHRAESGHALGKAQQAWLRAYRRIDLWARWLWIAAILAALVSGAIVASWLSAKFVLFGVVILVGNVLRLIPGTSSMALMAQIHRDGSTPEREAALYHRLSLTHPIILAIYACVVASVVLGVLKPG